MPTPLRLVFLHGFTQTGDFWDEIASAFQDDEVFTPDLPGHGSRPPALDTHDLWQSADLIADEHGPATYVGYSLGGRVALHIACARPDVVKRLVVVGAKGGIEDPTDRAYRHAADIAASERLERNGLEATIDEWLAQPFNQRLSIDRQRRADRLSNRAAGLASSLRHCGSGAQQPLWSQLANLSLPTLVVNGEEDLPHILDDGVRLHATIPQSDLVTVPGAGHAVPFEQPEAFIGLLKSFLKG